jgi:hypothetical protein
MDVTGPFRYYGEGARFLRLMIGDPRAAETEKLMKLSYL